MTLASLDWGIIIAFFAISLAIGLWVSRRSTKGTTEFFLSGRDMPWWLLGISMVATTFSADTPNLVADLVRKDGVAGNWAWWAFLLTGMLTVFVYAKLWRRSGILTDLEFYELRYSGKAAAFLRGFRAIYLGVFFNVIIMATVILAGIKIGGIMLGLSPIQTVLIVSTITVIYTSLGGLRGVILTDFVQFSIAMIGVIWASVLVVNLPEVGGLSNLLTHENVVDKISFFPDFNDRNQLITLLIIPLAVQWWSVWYPGAEPGGGGYVAQRMLSAKEESHAVGATLFFNIAHYALRPWPWILIALASLIVFPEVSDIAAAFPNVDPKVIKDDIAFPAMLTFLPNGLLGLVLASLIAALMSTISTHLNWGASYMVNDFYKRFIDQKASERHLIIIGQLSTLVLMILAAVFALFLENALQAFNIILQIGAGTGLLFILRWFWWRINAYSEITAMIVSFVVALYFEFLGPEDLDSSVKLISGVAITTVAWVAVTFLTPPTADKTLINFYKLIKPHRRGWNAFLSKHSNVIEADSQQKGSSLGLEIACMVAGCFAVYGLLFTTGSVIYGNSTNTLIALGVTAISFLFLYRAWTRVKQ
ncbi:MAG: sodium:solute symporter family protein [Bacteroidota bacterium]